MKYEFDKAWKSDSALNALVQSLESTGGVAYLVGGDRPYLLTMLYTGLSSSYFMLKTAAQIVPTELENTKARREVVVLVMGLTQFVSIWVLGKAGA